MADTDKLSEDDLQRVAVYLRSGYNDTERKPFRPLLLMGLLTLTVTTLSVLSIWIARASGIY